MNWKKLTLAGILLVLVVAWIMSGMLGQEPPDMKPSLARQIEDQRLAHQESPATVVRGRASIASDQHRTIELQGRIIDRNRAMVSAETQGRIIARPVQIGDSVKKGDLLCEIAINDRQLRVEMATDALTLAEKNYEGTLRLTDQGFQPELEKATRLAGVSLAEQQLLASQIELANTRIVAPVDGSIHEVHANVGDFITTGMPCATVLVLNPIYAQAYIAEQHLELVNVGDQANVLLPNGEVKRGVLDFISKKSDDQTRTFRLEIAIENPDYAISSGLSASIELITNIEKAHKVPASVIELDDNDGMGVKTVARDGTVEFYPIEIIREDADGIWVSGLPNATTIITLGNGLVVAGEQVAVEML